MGLEARSFRRRVSRDLPEIAPRSGRAGLFIWLTDARVFAPGGRVFSWHNPAHPGYPYPEAAALWLSWASWRREIAAPVPPHLQVQAVAARLNRDLRADGAIGRGDSLYLFDTCLAIHALLRAARAGWRVPAIALDPAIAGLQGFLSADTPVRPAPEEPPRGSDRWGSHHLRGAGLLGLAGRASGIPQLQAIAYQIRDRATDRPPRYTHALAYAVEGELALRALGAPSGRLDPAAAAARLAHLQRADGTLPAFLDGSGGPRLDSTAQAIRIWAAVDSSAHRAPIERALSALAVHQTLEGAMPWDGGSDRNTWASIFADQAIAWAAEGAHPTSWT